MMQALRGRWLPKQQVKPSTETLVEQVPEVPFYIPATGPATRPRRSLKHGDCFAVLDSHGDIGATPGGPDGIYHCDTRYLGHLELLLNGMQLLLLGSNMRDDNSLLTVDLTNPDVYSMQKLVLPKDTLHVVRTVFLWRATAYQRLRIQNHGDRPIKCTAVACVRQRFRRPVRGERPASHARAALCAPSALVTTRSRSTTRDSTARCATRCCRSIRRRRGYPPASRPTTLSLSPANFDASGRRRNAAARTRREPGRSLFHRGMRAAFKENRTASRSIATIVDIERDLQRGAVPLDGRPVDAHHRDQRGAISLRRHSVVLDHVRPRRPHHGDADAVVPSGAGQGRAAPARRPPGQGFRPAGRR